MMTFLNTHWTWQYVVMLLFIFWTAWKVYTRVWSPTLSIFLDDKRWRQYSIRRFLWATSATFMFHQFW